MSKRYFVYMLASKRNGTLYTGISGKFGERIWQHKNDVVEEFAKKYKVHILVWYEEHSDVGVASHERSRSNAGIAPGRFA